MTKTDDDRPEALARRLVPLIPQLMAGFKGLLGDAGGEPVPVGRPRGRHLATLMSLTAVGTASVSELATRLNLTLTHTSQIVGELAESGLVDRREDETDRRRTIVSVGPGGNDLIEAVVTGAARPLTPFFASLPKDDAAQLIGLLTLLISFLSQSQGQSQGPTKEGTGTTHQGTGDR